MRYLFLILSFLMTGLTLAQNQRKLDIVFTSIPDDFNRKNFTSNFDFRDSSEAIAHLRNILDQLYMASYLTAGVDSMKSDSNSLTTWMHVGSAYQWAEIDGAGIPKSWRNTLRLDSLFFKGQAINPNEFSLLSDKILTYAEENGYPFASLKLEDIELLENGVKARIQMDKGSIFTLDSLLINGKADVSPVYLYNYLGIQPGQIYEESKIRSIDQKLNALPFTRLKAPTRVYFGQGEYRLEVYLDKKRSDQVDGVVGVAPNSNANEGGLLLTGEANVALTNLFKRAVEFEMHWKSFLQRSQKLEIGTSYPFLFNTPLGFDASLNFVKYDTQFFTLNTKIGTKFLFNGSDYLKVFYNLRNTSLTSVDTVLVRSTRKIPVQNPVRVNSYGFEFRFQTLDYPYNPRSGFSITSGSNIGSRNILRDGRIEQVQFVGSDGSAYSLYDSLSLKDLQVEAQIKIDKFFPFGDNSTILASYSGNYLFAEQVFFNDLYQFGGNKSLRGFDENSLFGNSMSLFLLEYRYLLGTDANFHLFANAAYYEDKSGNRSSGIWSDLPFGFGAGVNLEVGTGLLTLDVAVGAEQGNRIDLSQSKIHFGIINYL